MQSEEISFQVYNGSYEDDVWNFTAITSSDQLPAQHHLAG